jgi:PAS domain S-box-containing protein
MPKNNLDKFWSPVLETIDNAFLRDNDNTIIKASAHFLRFLHKEEKDVIGKKCYQVIHGTDAPPDFCPYPQMLKSRAPEVAVAYEPKLNKWLNLRVTPLFDEKQQIIGSLHMVEDVTERKEQEAKLSRSRQAYLNMVESAHDVIFVVGRDGKLAYVNEYGAQALKKPLGDIIGKALDELFPADIARRQIGYIQQVLDFGKPLTAENKFAFPGGELWLNTCLTPLFDEQKNVVSVLGISRDISAKKNIEDRKNDELEQLRLFQRLAVDRELKIMEIEKGIETRETALDRLKAQAEKNRQALTEAEQKYLLLLDSSPVAIAITDREGHIIELNNVMQEMSGYDPEAYKKMNIIDVYARPEDRRRLLGVLVNASSVHDFEVQLKHRNGTLYWCLLNCDLAEIGGKKVIITTLRDITELKKTRESLHELENQIKALGS